MKQRTELLVRLYVSVLLLVGLAGLLIYQSFHINIVEGDHWRSQGKKAHNKTVSLPAERGDILSDDGSLLATSLPFFDIRMDPLTESITDAFFESQVDSLAWYLQRHLYPAKTVGGIAAWLRSERNKGNRYILLKRGVNYDQLELIKTFPILRLGKNRGGLVVERQESRRKPLAGLASRTLGIPEGDRPGVGLEKYYDDDLNGVPGLRAMRRVSGGQWIPAEGVEEIVPVRGADIKTTINIAMQDEVHHALLGALIEHEAEKGVAILMEVKTGAIKAITNLRRNAKGYYEESYNDAVGSAYEPGSTMKLASVMALLEEGSVDLESLVDVTGARTRFYDRTMDDSSPHDMRMISLRKTFEKSSNVGIAKMVTKHFRGGDKEQAFCSRLQSFGLGQSTGIDLIGEAKPVIKDGVYGKQQWYGTSLPWVSVGYESQVAPLQMLNFYNAIANDGKLMKPYLVDQVIKENEVVYQVKPMALKNKIASQYTISAAQSLLEGVVLRGTAENIQTKQLKLAGKTGTTQVDYANVQNKKTKHISSFAGYFPADAPRYSCIVVIWNPQKRGYYGSTVAAPVFKQIAIGTFRSERAGMANYPPDLDQEDKEVQVKAHGKDMSQLIAYLNLDSEGGQGAEWTQIQGKINEKMNKTSILEGENWREELIGMGARDALTFLETRGYQVDLTGYGEVVAVIDKKKGSKDAVHLMLE